MLRTVTQLIPVLSFLATLSAPGVAEGNPMWKVGYAWTCIQGDALTCERGDNCAFSPSSGQPIEIRFEDNQVRIGTTKLSIKRHYSQKVAGSPLTDEVKIELSDNSVIWLSPIDAGGTWSTSWIGMTIEPRGGIALSVSHALFCRPKS